MGAQRICVSGCAHWSGQTGLTPMHADGIDRLLPCARGWLLALYWQCLLCRNTQV